MSLRWDQYSRLDTIQGSSRTFGVPTPGDATGASPGKSGKVGQALKLHRQQVVQ